MKLLLFMITWVVVLTIVGCNDEEIKTRHPVAVAVVETLAKDTGDVLEPVVDAELHLPIGTTEKIVNEIEK